MGTGSNGLAEGGPGGTLGSEGIATRTADSMETMANGITGRGGEAE